MAAKTQLHWYGSEHTNMDPFRMLFNAASSEKEAMMSLNERLGDLFCRLDRNKGDSGSNCVVYMQAIECLQEELRLLKACYETEISKLRRDLELMTGEKQDCDGNYERLKTQQLVLQSKYDDEVAGHQKRRDEVATLKSTVKQKECEIAELSSYMECLKAELDLLKPRADKYAHDCESYRQQFECEKRLRQEAEDKHCQIVDKLGFDARMHDQQVRDLHDRILKQQRIIDQLHEQIKKLTDGQGGGGCDTNVIIQRVREQMQAEIDKYKRETEEAVTRTVAEMKATLEARLKEKIQLENDRERLEALVAQLQGQVNELQAQVSAGFQSNQQLQYQMQADKSQCTCTVRDLEARLLDVQDRLMQKVREVTAAREVQTSLRTEIESYKALIECQEKKLHQPCLPPVDSGSSAKASIFTGRGFPPKTSSGYGGSALNLPGSAACNSCSPGNRAFGGNNGRHNGGVGFNGGGFGAGCGPRNCASRDGGQSAGKAPNTPGAILMRMGAGKMMTGGNCKAAA